MTGRVEVDVADLVELRRRYESTDSEIAESVAIERLIAAIPKPRMVPTEEAVRLAHRAGISRLQVVDTLTVLHEAGLLDPKWMTEEEP